MGATQSSTQTSIDVANSFVTNVATNVITKNTTTGSGNQILNVACTDAAFAAATAACSADTQSRNALVAAIAQTHPDQAITLGQIEPASCSLCSAENITMDMNVSINTSAIADNTIANQIKSELDAKLQSAIDNKTVGGIGLTDSQIQATTSIQNYVENNFNTNIVNDTLNTYTFSQTLNASNQKLSNINMKLVATAVGSAMVQNAIQNSADLKSQIEAATTAASDTTGSQLPSIFGNVGAALAGIIGFIVLIFVGIIVLKIIMNSHRSQPIMPQMQQPFMPQMQQPFMPQMQQPFINPPQMQQPFINPPQMQQPFMPQMQQPFMPQMQGLFRPQV